MIYKVYTANDSLSSLTQEREHGVQRGALFGFRGWKNSVSAILGSTCYLYGAPYSGKSTLKREMLRQLTEYYGWNHLVIDPETGNLDRIASVTVRTYAGKDLGPNYGNQMSKEEFHLSVNEVSQKYHFLDAMGKEKLEIDSVFETHKDIEKKLNKKIHTISFDPWNYLKHNKSEYGGWEGYLEHILPYIYAKAQESNVFVFIVHHVRDQQMRTKKIGKEVHYYYPPPNPRDLGGGQSWYRYGMLMICCWIPPDWWVDQDGYAVQEGETHIFFQKKKPEGCAVEGDKTTMSKLFYLAKQKRYQELYNYKRYDAANPNTFDTSAPISLEDSEQQINNDRFQKIDLPPQEEYGDDYHLFTNQNGEEDDAPF